MAVIDFRRHFFQYLQNAGHTDDNGDYVSDNTQFSESIECNAVPNGGDAIVRNAEGKRVEYSFTLYCDPDVRDFEYGEMIRLNREGIIYELSVKGFHRYVNMAKIWV